MNSSTPTRLVLSLCLLSFSPTITSGFPAAHKPLPTGQEPRLYIYSEAWLRQRHRDQGSRLPPHPVAGRSRLLLSILTTQPLAPWGLWHFPPDQGTPAPDTHCARHNWSFTTSGSGSESAFLLSHSTARSWWAGTQLQWPGTLHGWGTRRGSGPDEPPGLKEKLGTHFLPAPVAVGRIFNAFLPQVPGVVL